MCAGKSNIIFSWETLSLSVGRKKSGNFSIVEIGTGKNAYEISKSVVTGNIKKTRDCLGRKKAEIQSSSSNNLKSTLENVKRSRFVDTHQKFSTNQNGYFKKHLAVFELRS